MRDTFDETNPDLCLIFQALHTALIEFCGGNVPFLQNPSDKNNNNNGAPVLVVDPEAWRQVLHDTCRSSINATTSNPLDNLQGKPWNVEVRTITSLFNRFTSGSGKKQRQQSSSSSANKRKKEKGQKTSRGNNNLPDKDTSTTQLVLTSDLGVTRTVSSSVEWAQLVLPRMEEALQPTAWRGHVTIPTGFLVWTSPVRAAALYDTGRRPCGSCEAWPKGGEKGLWWHQQEQHAVHHASATACAAATRLTRAVMIYEPRRSLRELCRQSTNDETTATSSSSSSSSSQTGDATADTASPQDRQNLAFKYATNGDLFNLQHAITQGWVDPIQNLDARGATLLLWAAGAGHVNVVQYLVETCGCNARQPQRQYRRGFAGRTALHWACRKGHLNVVKYILQHCGRVALEDRTADGTTAVGWAAWQGQQDILEYLWNEWQCDMQTVNKFGCNALLWAAQGTADATTMEWLVHVAGCPLTHTNGNGHGILHKAAQRNKPDIAAWFQTYVMTILLAEGSMAQTCRDLLGLFGPDREGCTPSDLAGIEGHQKLAVQVCECERVLWLKILEHVPDLAWPFMLNPSAVADEYGPGCGTARLWNLFRKRQ